MSWALGQLYSVLPHSLRASACLSLSALSSAANAEELDGRALASLVHAHGTHHANAPRPAVLAALLRRAAHLAEDQNDKARPILVPHPYPLPYPPS